MKIEVVQGTTGLLLVHVLGRERLACEAAYNRFLVSHNLREWNLIVRTNLLDRSLVAQSITPDGQASSEIVIAPASDIRAKLTELLEVELDRWLQHSSAVGTSDRGN
jgi:hypothetical protein